MTIASLLIPVTFPIIELADRYRDRFSQKVKRLDEHSHGLIKQET
jgi:hypothetical protein